MQRQETKQTICCTKTRITKPMNYFAHYQQQEFDPSSQTQQLSGQSMNDYYSYSYSNPQFTSIHPYSYHIHNLTVQPSQKEEQEPNPPGVTPPPPPPTEQNQNSYHQFQANGVAARILTVGPQPIVQSLYGGIGVVDGITPGGDAQHHFGPKPNVSHHPYHALGRGRGRALHMNVASPSQNQTVTTHGGSHIQGGPLKPPSQSCDKNLGPRSNVMGHPHRVRGRGKGRGQHKHVAPAQNQKVLTQGRLDIRPSQHMPQSTHSASVLPPPKVVCCELCRVECNTIEILKQHMNGKKHKKKLKVFEDLQNLNTRVISRQVGQTSTSEPKSEVPSQPDQIEGSGDRQLQPEILPSQETNEENEVAVEKREVEEVEPTKESEEKVGMEHSGGVGRGLKRKMRGGKGSRKTRPCDRPKKLAAPPKPKEVIPLVCELCNVKCESPVVFQSHLVGKKHQSKAKRFLSNQETPGQELIQAQIPATQALDQQKANDSTSISYQGASVPNLKIIDVQSSSAKVEATSQPESLPSNIGASTLVNAEASSNKGNLETGAQNNAVAAKMVAVAAGSEHVTSGATLDGGSLSEESVVFPSSALAALPGPHTTTGQAQSKEMAQA